MFTFPRTLNTLTGLIAGIGLFLVLSGSATASCGHYVVYSDQLAEAPPELKKLMIERFGSPAKSKSGGCQGPFCRQTPAPEPAPAPTVPPAPRPVDAVVHAWYPVLSQSIQAHLTDSHLHTLHAPQFIFRPPRQLFVG